MCASGPGHDPDHTFDELLAQLGAYGLEPVILGWGQPWKGLGSKPKLLLKYLKETKGQPKTTLFIDAFDVLFRRSPEALPALMKKHYPTAEIVFNAERAPFPDFEGSNEAYPDPGTPYRYLNSGFILGKTSAIRKLLESMDLSQYPDDYQKEDGSWHHEIDQGWILKEFPKQVVPMSLDYKAILCQTLHAEPSDLKTEALTLHGNGGGKQHPLLRELRAVWAVKEDPQPEPDMAVVTGNGETCKRKQVWIREGLYAKYIAGKEGIDVGCGRFDTFNGADPINDNFFLHDKDYGDATFMDQFPDNKFDVVWASHIMEHLDDPLTAIANWLRICRPEGIVAIFVPHRDLYEDSHKLPSRWNLDHRTMWLPDSYDPPNTFSLKHTVEDAIQRSGIPAEVLWLRVCDRGWEKPDEETHAKGEYSIEIVITKKAPTL